jgi:2-methylaconitate cis-trans-isomerase PrpF
MGLVRPHDPETRVVIFNINTTSTIEVVLHTPGAGVTYDGDAAIDGVSGTAAPVKENFAGTVGSKTGKLLPTGKTSEEIDGITVTCIDVAVPMVIVPASAVGKTGYESKAELDADAALISRLEKIRVEAGKRMGLGDCSALVIPKPVLVAPPRAGGTIASRDFVPFNCHATYSVTGSMALSTACILPGTVANRVAAVKESARQVVSIEHPGGVIDVEVLARQVGETFLLEEANLLRTCRKLFEGQICIPSRVWDGTRKARDAMQLAIAA